VTINSKYLRIKSLYAFLVRTSIKSDLGLELSIISYTMELIIPNFYGVCLIDLLIVRKFRNDSFIISCPKKPSTNRVKRMRSKCSNQ